MDIEQFPSPANGKPTAGDVWGLLAHPVWGMGALHQKVENLNDHVNRVETDTTKRLDFLDETLKTNKQGIEAMENRLIARDFNEARFARDKLAQAEKETQEKEEHHKHIRSLFWEKGFYVAGVVLGGMALAISVKFDLAASHVWDWLTHL